MQRATACPYQQTTSYLINVPDVIRRDRLTQDLLMLQAERNGMAGAGGAPHRMQVGWRIIELRRELGFGVNGKPVLRTTKALWKVRIVPPAATDVGEAHTS